MGQGTGYNRAKELQPDSGSGHPAVAFMYFNAAIATTATLDTPIKFAGTTQMPVSSGFSTTVNNRIQYDGSNMGIFHVSVGATLDTDTNTNATVALYNTGTAITGADVDCDVLTTTGATVSLTAIVVLNSDDYLELYLDSSASGDITLQKGTIAVSQVY